MRSAPWRVSDTAATDQPIIINSEGQLVAEVWWQSGDGAVNAKLIAAAPDLHAALVAFWAYENDVAPTHSWDEITELVTDALGRVE